MKNFYKTAKGWLTLNERDWLYHLASQSKVCILNIGVEYGASVVCLRAGNNNVPIVAIDLIGSDKLDDENLHYLRRVNLIEILEIGQFGSFPQFLKGDSGSLAHDWNEPLDLIFVDGDHTTDGVLRDCVFAQYLVKDGVICFHDCYNSPMASAVNKSVSKWFGSSQDFAEEELVDSIRTFRKVR